MIEDSLYQKKLYESLAKAKPTEDRYRGRGYDRGQEAEQKQVKIMEDRRDKNTVEDRIMDSGASFHATYCKEKLERFNLRCSKVNTVGFGNPAVEFTKGSVVVAHGKQTVGCPVNSEIGMRMLASKDNVPDVRKVDIYFCKPGGLGKQKNLSFTMSVKTRKLQTLEQVHIEGYRPTFISSI
ncbi:hypothetical protein Tco_1156012 [Tanacetum coccineum]